MENDNQKIQHDLQKLQNNYFDAAIKNLEVSNNIFYELTRQLFNLTTFYLIFTATLFFFLEDKFSFTILHLSINKWIILAIISGTSSIVLGIIALYRDKIFLLHSARYYFKKSQQVFDHIKEKGQITIDSIPKELEIDKKQMVSSGLVNFLIIFQAILFVGTILLTVIPIIRIITL